MEKWLIDVNNSFSPVKDFKIPSNPTLKIPLAAVFDDLDIEVEEDELKTRGNKSKTLCIIAWECFQICFPAVY